MNEITRYYDSRFSRNVSKIVQGQFVIIAPEEAVVTTLGSCVAACIHDVSTGTGGMNHFMLPDVPGNSPASSAARYGVHAMELLINELLKRGARRSDLRAKVFGAAMMIASDAMRVGERNAAFVEAYLMREGIPILGADLRGTLPRKVYFFPDTGRVLVRYLRTLRNRTLEERDQAYYLALRGIAMPGDGEVF